MRTALIFLLVLTVCGFIAYIGDLLGRRLGKKRLTLFGLRPKHTAILLTIVTGVLIAGVTLGVALAVVPGFSKVVTEGEKLLAQNQRLIGQNSALEGQARRLQQANEAEKTRNAELTGSNKTLTTRNTALEIENAVAVAANQRLTAASAGLTLRNKTLQSENSGLTTRNEALRANTNRLQQAQARLIKEQNRLNGLVSDLSEEGDRYREGRYIFQRGEDVVRLPIPANPPLDVTRGAVDRLLYQVRTQAEAEIKSLTGKAPTGRVQVVVLEPEGYEGPAEQAAIMAWLARRTHGIRNSAILLRARAAQNCLEGRPIRITIEPLRNERAFQQGEEVARQRFDAGLNRGVILRELMLFLQQVHRNAIERPHSMLPSKEGLGELSYEDLVEVMDRIAANRGPMEVVARTKKDIRRADPLIVELEVTPLAVTRNSAR